MRIQDFLKTPVAKPKEVWLVGGLLAGLTGLWLAATPFIVLVCALYLATYPFERVAAETHRTVSELYWHQVAQMVAQYVLAGLVFVAAVGLLRLRQWGRVAVEFILWAFLAWCLGFTVWMHSGRDADWWLGMVAWLHWPPSFGAFFWFWLHLPFIYVPLAYTALPALGIRVLHRPAVADAIRAAEAARPEERASDAHPPTNPQHWPPTGDRGPHG